MIIKRKKNRENEKSITCDNDGENKANEGYNLSSNIENDQNSVREKEINDHEKDELKIQDRAIPPLLEGNEVIGDARTGSGKTLADDLARLSLQGNPVYTSIDNEQKRVTNEGLEQGYCVVPNEKRFSFLYSFLKWNLSKKVMVFFSSCDSVKFYSDLLKYMGVDCYDIYGKKKQHLRNSTIEEFHKADKGILLCTDVVERGLDIPVVDWILQYDPPKEPKKYIHRIGRTSRGEGEKGNALLVLIPEELQFLSHLKAAKVPLTEYEFNEKKLKHVQPYLEKLIANNYYLNKSAKDAYRSYILAYHSHSMKDIFNVHLLDLQSVAASFGLSKPPNVNLNVDNNASMFKRKRH